MENGKVIRYGFLKPADTSSSALNYSLSLSTAYNNPFVSGDIMKCEAKKITSTVISSNGTVTVSTQAGVDLASCQTAVADVRTDK